MQISDVALINVALAGPAIATQDFGTSLVYAYHTHYTDWVRTYESGSWSVTMITEGFSALEPAYLAIQAVFAQDPKPDKAKLGRRSAAETQTVRITIPSVGPALTRYSLVVESAAGVKETAAFTDDGTPNAAEIFTGLAAAINALNAAVTATPAATYVDVVSDVANVYFTFRDLSVLLTLRDNTTSSGISADLTAIKAADDDWYGLGLATPAPTAIESCADWIEANAPHVFSASTHDMGVITSAVDDIATSIMGQSYQRTLVSYHSKCLQHFGLAWQAGMLTYEPGQVDWSAKTVNGCEPDTFLTATQDGYAKAKNASTYGLLGKTKAPWTGEATTGSGYFIDLVITKDWTKARLEEFIVAKRKALPKVKLTDNGVGALTLEAMMEIVKLGQENDAFDTDPTTVVYVVPKVLSRPESERKARQFRGSKLSCRTTQGAHLIEIDVNLAV
jgi:hypothetical protein